MERFDELLATYIESGLEEDDRTELEELLKADPSRREAFVELARLHRMLDSELGAMDDREIARGVMAGIDRSETDLVAAVMRGARRVKARHIVRRTRRVRWVPALVAAAACVVAALVLTHGDRKDPVVVDTPRQSVPAAVAIADVSGIEGACELIAFDGTTTSLAEDTVLHAGDRLETGDGKASVTYHDDETLVECGPSAAVTFVDADGAKRVVLGNGALTAHVASQPPGKAMTLVTPQAEATVLGTTLALSTGDDATRLEVNEGSVRLARLSDRKSIDVSAGQYAVAAIGRDLVAFSMVRVFDDFEGGKTWAKTHWSDECAFEISDDRASSGTHSLRVEYHHQKPTATLRGYSSMQRPLTLLDGDAFLTLRLFVIETDWKTGMNVLLCLKDNSAWFMGHAMLRNFPKGQWVEFRVNVTSALKKNNDKGGDTYRPAEVVTCSWGVHGGSAIVYLDDFALHPQSAFTKGE